MKNAEKPKVAVIPVAGKGSRWMPITRSVAKELLPVWRRTCASYALEEAIKAGCEEIIFVVAHDKAEVFNHFLRFDASDLSEEFQDFSFTKLHESVQLRACVQESPKGLGDAILCAAPLVGERDFVILLPDEVLMQNGTALLMEHYPSILLMEVSYEERKFYGMVAGSNCEETGLFKLNDLVEKPEPSQSPSSLAVTGRYCLNSKIFDYLRSQAPGKNGEIQLTDALRRFCKDYPLYGVVYSGKRHDVGQPFGLLTASLEFALRDPLASKQARASILNILEEYP